SIPAPSEEHEKDFYANYGSILEILDHRFPQVRVKGGRIMIVRRGINAVLLDDPLILVNEIPTGVTTLESIPTQEVKTIRVISKGSEAAAYGYRGMNGVIIVQLKTADSH
ncbi:MAG: TonB-dependent receptor plug domain-containing protein, partial [Saprospiraceae bacterium]